MKIKSAVRSTPTPTAPIPARGAWRKVRQSAAARRRRRQTARYAAGGLVAAALLVTGVVGVAALRGDEGPNVTAGPASTRTGDIVVVVDEKVVVVSSKDGRVVRTLAKGAKSDGASSVEVSPDGMTVYFTRADPEALCEQEGAPQIVSVPIEGGPITVVASGRDPIVSPDGRYLAYATAGPDQCGPPTLMVVQALGSPELEQRLFEDGGAPLRPLSWSSDGRRILYAGPAGGDMSAEIKEVELGAPGDPLSPRTVPVPNDVTAATYLGELGTLAVIQDSSIHLQDPRDPARVLEVDATTGAPIRELFTLPATFVSNIASDQSGTKLLVASEDIANDPDLVKEALLRWSGGDPVGISRFTSPSGLRDAAWVNAS